MLPELSQEEILRYSRHLIIPEVGLEGQRRLKAASVLVVGVGGLGSPVALYLAGAGIGRIGLVDYDLVEASNLQRQVIHDSGRVKQFKAESGRERMLALNPHIQVDAIVEPFVVETAKEIAAGYDILVDCSDNFPTRYLVNDLCALSGRPDVYGAVFRFEGQVCVFDATRGPCYRCLFPAPPPPNLAPPSSDGGVFGILPGTIGTMQAAEVIKLVLGIGEPLLGKLVLYDALDVSFQTVRLGKNPRCRLCGSQPEITALVDTEAFSGVQIDHHLLDRLPGEFQITPAELAENLSRGAKPVLLDVREPVEQQVSRLEEAVNIPFGFLASRMEELNREDEIVIFCRTGSRSERAVHILASAGFLHVKNLRGGLNAWASEVEPGMLRY